MAFKVSWVNVMDGAGSLIIKRYLKIKASGVGGETEILATEAAAGALVAAILEALDIPEWQRGKY